MPKSANKKLSEVTRDARKTAHRLNRLTSIKNELEGGRISKFDQIFAIISESRMAIEMNTSFGTFRKKTSNPGEFTFNEIVRMAALFGVDCDIMTSFIWNLMNLSAKVRKSMSHKLGEGIVKR